MIKRTIFCAFVLALTTSAVFAQAQTDWLKFKSEAGRFSVDMPCEAKIEKEPITEGKVSVEQVYHSCAANHLFFSLAYIDIVSKADPSFLLDKFRDGIIKGAEAVIVTEKVIMLGKNPGRSIIAKGSIDDNDVVYNWHLYRVGDRMYSVGASGYAGTFDQADVDKFLSAFALVK